jgi:two-component system OmpR family response regulator
LSALDLCATIGAAVCAPGPLIFIVDDEPEVRAYLCEILEHAGYRTRAFESGTTALQLAPLERPALVLLDIYLPDLDGYTVASRLREQPAAAHTPIVFITGADAPVHRILTHGLGASYLHKPISAERLLRMVGQVLQSAAGGGPPEPP